jgi:hypothetical protein
VGYELEAIIAPAEAIHRYMDTADSDRFVGLPQGFAMIPFDERTCEVIEHSLGDSLEYQFLKIPFEEYNSQCAKILQVISEDGIASFITIDCAGGPGARSGVVYQNKVKVYDRFSLPDPATCQFVWQPHSGGSRLLAKLLKNPLGQYVPNSDGVPSITDEVLQLLGVQVDSSHLDAFDQLGLGRHRYTKDWLQREG